MAPWDCAPNLNDVAIALISFASNNRFSYRYSEQEAFSVGSYQIVDASSDVVADGDGDDSVEIADGRAVMTISLDGIESGDYKLLISNFVGSKKADQPLKINGAWECNFTI